MLSYFISFWIIVNTIFYTLIISFLLLIRKNDNFKPFIWLGRWAKWALVFQKIEVIGKENLNRDKNYLIYSNHQSYIDILVLFQIIDVPFSMMAKDSLFAIPLFGWMLNKLGYISVKRDEARKAAKALIEAIKKLKTMKNVIIFPEGTWSERLGQMLEFKAGFYTLAKRSGVSLLPVTLIGCHKINPPDSLRFYPGRLKVIIHPSIEVEEYSKYDKENFLIETRKIIQNTINKERLSND